MASDSAAAYAQIRWAPNQAVTESLFICYPASEENLAEKLRDHIRELDVPAWVYSIDRTAGRVAWDEIEERIRNCRAVFVLVTQDTISSEGQRKELHLAADAIRGTRPDLHIIPLAVDVAFQRLPATLGGINGFVVYRNHLPALACTLAEQLFPEKREAREQKSWHYPRPGEWLRIVAVDDCLDEQFAVDDEVYFRRVSPTGFFECFCPQTNGLFWFYPPNLGPGPGIDRDRERDIPAKYAAISQFGA